MRIVFAGTPDFAAAALQALINSPHEVVAVYTQPDRPAGRGRKPRPSPCKALALEHDIPVEQPTSLRGEGALARLEDYRPDVMVVAAYGLILPQAVLDLPHWGCLNIHASLLPRWRGAAPIQRAIAAGDETSGITIMQMEAGLDTGPMLLKRETPLAPDETGGSLHDRLATLGADAILDALDGLKAGSLDYEPQDDWLACYAHKLSKAEGHLDWHRSAAELERLVRAFNPWPITFAQAGDSTLRIHQARLEPSNTEKRPGEVVARTPEGAWIQTSEGQLVLETIQLPGSRPQSIRDLINGGKPLLEPGQLLT
ncbi:methionyl-tRNA formyltransferase [Marinobacteraceae bacterium S3BR75-40.1]